MKSPAFLLLALLWCLALSAVAADPKPKPPVGVPDDAVPFHGKWYRLYLEKTTWRRANDKCRTVGGQLVCIHDAATQAFLTEFSKGLEVWIGATDEKVEGLWVWVDGTEMKYTAWGPHQPLPPGEGRAENYAGLGYKGRAWFDAKDGWPCVGYICEWKGK